MKATKFSRVKEMIKDSFKEGDDSHEFLPILAEIEEEPANPLGRTMFWTLITLVTLTTIWLIFGKADVVVTSRGKIIPDGEIKILQPLDTGVVKKILIKEGDYVKKGQTLIEINPSTTEPQLESLKANLEYINIERQRLNGGNVSSNDESAATQRSLYQSALSDLNSQLQSKNAEIKGVDEQIRNYRTQLSINSAKEARMTDVSDIIAKNDLEDVRAKSIDYRSKIQGLLQQKSGLLKEAAYIRSNFKTKNLTELADRDKQANELGANIKEIEFKKNQQNIVSPVDGYVVTLFIHTTGGVVTPAEKLLSVVPVGAPLVVKATVADKDIGFITTGMPVLIKIDTFEFQKYGMIDGKVKKISKDSIEDQKLGPVYDVYITPLQHELKVEGRMTPITTGMSLTAEIKIHQRRIIEFFIYPMIKYWNQAITVR